MGNEEFKVGQTVEIIESGNFFYDKGAKAILTSVDADGDWWADFSDCGNKPGSWSDDAEDGIFCIGLPAGNFKAAEA